MKTVRPFGNPGRATIMVIGHDPRLQQSQAEADVAFFFDYLAHPRPASSSEASNAFSTATAIDPLKLLSNNRSSFRNP